MILQQNPERRLGGIDFILRRGADLFPDRVAIDDRGCGRSLTYRELYSRATKLARGLERLGVQKGEGVAYAFFSEHAAIETLFACGILGAVAMPLNIRLHPNEAHAYLERHSCRVFIGNTKLKKLAPGSIEGLILTGDTDENDGRIRRYEDFLGAESDAPLPPRAYWEDPYMMAMTGGTTGLSKAAVWGHGGCMMDTLSVMSHMHIPRDVTSVCLAPTFHAAGLGWGLLPVLWQAGCIIMPPTPSFDPEFVFEMVRSGQGQYLLIVPAMVYAMHEAWDGVPFTGVNSICVTSAPTPVQLRHRLVEMFPEAMVMAGYGMTETLSMTIQSPSEFIEMPLSVGTPSAVTRVRVLDEAGKEVPRGTPGRIFARSMAMAYEYHNDPENTAKAFQSISEDSEGLQWLETGDIGFIAKTGQLTIVDRAKDVIITGGENVGSIELESVLSTLPDIQDCAVIGQPDPKWGEKIVAVLVKKETGGEDMDIARNAVDICKKNLADYKVPREVVLVDVLPRTSFGKIAKSELVGMSFDRRFTLASLRD